MRRAALAWVGHPASIVALAAMIANDHWLKAAYGTWWTGKFSDVAGLVFFPAVVAAVVALVVPSRAAARLGWERLAGGALAVTAVGFVWVKATAAGAAAASALLTALAGPSTVRLDASDLLALPALGVAAWAAWAAMRSAPARGEVSGSDENGPRLSARRGPLPSIGRASQGRR